MYFLGALRQGEARLRVPPSREALAGVRMFMDRPRVARIISPTPLGSKARNLSVSVFLSRLFVFLALSLL